MIGDSRAADDINFRSLEARRAAAEPDEVYFIELKRRASLLRLMAMRGIESMSEWLQEPGQALASEARFQVESTQDIRDITNEGES